MINKILVATFLFIAIKLQAQDKQAFNIKALNKEKIESINDLFLQATSSKYELIKIDSLKSKNTLTYHFSNGNDLMRIYFFRYKSEGNKDLDQISQIKYRLAGLDGKYKDLFPIWKKCFQDDAEFVQVAKQGHGKIILTNDTDDDDKYSVTFNKLGDSWIIEIKNINTNENARN